MIPEIIPPARSSGSGVRRRNVLAAGSPLLLVVVVAAVIVAWGGHSGRVYATAAAPNVVRAVGAESEYANVIAQIGGRHVSVTAVMDNPNTDPHAYQVSTSVAQSIAAAQLVVQNGAGYDGFMKQLEAASPRGSRAVVTVQRLLGVSATVPNPHLWYAPYAMPKVARRIAADLAHLQPDHAPYFAGRLRKFLDSMVSLHRDIASFRARFGGTAVATSEPVADYLLTALGLKDLTPFRFQQNVMNGVDPSPEDSAYEQHLLTHHKVRIFCYNAQVLTPATTALQALARRHGIPVVAVYETMPTGYTFQSWMRAEIDALARALDAHRSTEKL